MRKFILRASNFSLRVRVIWFKIRFRKMLKTDTHAMESLKSIGVMKL